MIAQIIEGIKIIQNENLKAPQPLEKATIKLKTRKKSLNHDNISKPFNSYWKLQTTSTAN